MCPIRRQRVQDDALPVGYVRVAGLGLPGARLDISGTEDGCVYKHACKMTAVACPDGSCGPAQEGEIGASHAFFVPDVCLIDCVGVRLQGQVAEVEVGADLDVPLLVGDRRLQVRQVVHNRHLSREQPHVLLRAGTKPTWICISRCRREPL